MRMGCTAPIGGAEAFHTGGKSLDPDVLRDLGAFSTHLCMDLILEQLWELCEMGFLCLIRLVQGGPLDVWAIVVPYLIRFVADLMEHYASLSLPYMCHIKLHLSNPEHLGRVNVRPHPIDARTQTHARACVCLVECMRACTHPHMHAH